MSLFVCRDFLGEKVGMNGAEWKRNLGDPFSLWKNERMRRKE